MTDTGFHVPAAKAGRFAACYSADGKGGKTLQDDPATSPYLKPATFFSGGGGLVSTAADYLTFCRRCCTVVGSVMSRLLSPKTIELMTANHLPEARPCRSCRVRFSARRHTMELVSVLIFGDAAAGANLDSGSAGEYSWGGAATTSFWIDPAEDLIAIFMTQPAAVGGLSCAA